MLVLLIGVYACIELRVLFERGTDARDLIKTFHYVLGISVFILVSIRLINRILSPKVQRESYGAYQKWVSKLMFFALYGLMILMPILGYLLVSAEGDLITVFKMELPTLNIEDKELAHQIEEIHEIHEILGKVGYGLIGIHALTGLFHHFILRVQTMKRMLRFKN